MRQKFGVLKIEMYPFEARLHDLALFLIYMSILCKQPPMIRVSASAMLASSALAQASTLREAALVTAKGYEDTVFPSSPFLRPFASPYRARLSTRVAFSYPSGR